MERRTVSLPNTRPENIKRWLERYLAKNHGQLIPISSGDAQLEQDFQARLTAYEVHGWYPPALVQALRQGPLKGLLIPQRLFPIDDRDPWNSLTLNLAPDVLVELPDGRPKRVSLEGGLAVYVTPLGNVGAELDIEWTYPSLKLYVDTLEAGLYEAGLTEKHTSTEGVAEARPPLGFKLPEGRGPDPRNSSG